MTYWRKLQTPVSQNIEPALNEDGLLQKLEYKHTQEQETV